VLTYAAFTPKGFDDQKRNLTFVKTDFQEISNFIPAVLSRLSILFINYTLRDLDNTKMLLFKLFVRFLAVKPTCVNAALITKISRFIIKYQNRFRLRTSSAGKDPSADDVVRRNRFWYLFYTEATDFSY